MNKVLFVDDEVLAIRFIHDMVDWAELGCEVCGSATNGAAALSLVKAHQPDIIFMDVRMPDGDGLALSRQLLQFNQSCKIIILTAYRDFASAREAVQTGVFEFIIKHELTPALLRGVVSRAGAALEDERQIAHVARQKCLESLYGGSGVDDAVLRLLDAQGSRFVFLVVKLNSFLPALGALPALSFSPTLPGLLACARLTSMEWGLLLSLKATVSEAETQRALHTLAAEGRAQFEAQTGHNALVLHSGVLTACGEIATAGQNRTALQGGYVLTGETLLPLGALSAGASPANVAQALAETLRTGEPAALEAACQGMGNIVPYAGCLETACAFLLQKYEALLQSEALVAQKRAEYGALHPPDAAALRGWLKRELAELRLFAADGGTSVQATKAARAARWVRQHYAEELSVDDVAAFVGVSTGYLQGIFKKEFGCTVVQYVQQQRLNAAKEMLLEGRYKVYEVARRCGFGSSQYFSAVFTAACGMTPTVYQAKKGVGAWDGQNG